MRPLALGATLQTTTALQQFCAARMRRHVAQLDVRIPSGLPVSVLSLLPASLVHLRSLSVMLVAGGDSAASAHPSPSVAFSLPSQLHSLQNLQMDLSLCPTVATKQCAVDALGTLVSLREFHLVLSPPGSVSMGEAHAPLSFAPLSHCRSLRCLRFGLSFQELREIGPAQAAQLRALHSMERFETNCTTAELLRLLLAPSHQQPLSSQPTALTWSSVGELRSSTDEDYVIIGR
jgi:hypothetical protein